MTEGSPSLFPIQIPLLIQEKVDFYIWLDRIKTVNDQYFKMVHVCEPSSNHIFLSFGIGIEQDNKNWWYHKQITFIVNDTYKNARRGLGKWDYHINKFNTSPYNYGYGYEIALPTKYYYSSGLDAVEGYKFNWRQKHKIYEAKFVTRQRQKQKQKQYIISICLLGIIIGVGQLCYNNLFISP